MTVSTFEYIGLPYRVLFGQDTRRDVLAEVKQLGVNRALVLSTPEQTDTAREVEAALGDVAVGSYNKAEMHVPTTVVADAMKTVNETRADCFVAVGGGSTIGLAKALALETDLPIIAIPTTYAGSEMTTVYGLTEDGVKTTGKDRRVLPASVIYDIELSRTLPYEAAVTSGMNAIAHAAEGLYADNGNPLMSILAEEGIRATARGLRTLESDAQDTDGRRDCAYGAWICGMVLASVGMALHHKLCHTLGGSFALPHAQTHTIVLPHAIAYNITHAPEAGAAINRALGTPEAMNAGQALHDLATELGAPIRLSDFGFGHDDIAQAVELTLEKPYANPRPVTQAGLEHLLAQAVDGQRPSD